VENKKKVKNTKKHNKLKLLRFLTHLSPQKLQYNLSALIPPTVGAACFTSPLQNSGSLVPMF